MRKGPIALGSDHGGFALKLALRTHLESHGWLVLDVGTDSEQPCDYPVFARRAAEAIAQGQAVRGIVIDGAGIGSSMVANKVRGVRAGLAFNEATARNASEHNNANLITLGAGYLSTEQAIKIVEAFLNTSCTVERHLKRVAMIDDMDRPRQISEPMQNHQDLVDQIVRVLSQNPAFLSGIQASAPGVGGACPSCSGCGQCVSKHPDSVRGVLSGVSGRRVSAALGIAPVAAEIASLIDHTLLKPAATYEEIDRLCDEAKQYGFASVCVNPMHVKRCAARLAGTKVKVCSVIGFPLGANPKEIKALEARRAIRDGAKEIDMVIAIGALKSGDRKYVYEDILMVAEAARDGSALLKVILETGLLTDEEKVIACELSKKARADFVKTSTGFGNGGATAHDVALMARAVDHKLGVKASGGVKNKADAEAMVAAGATRIGASVGVQIAKEAKGQAVGSAGSSAGGY